MKIVALIPLLIPLACAERFVEMDPQPEIDRVCRINCEFVIGCPNPNTVYMTESECFEECRVDEAFWPETEECEDVYLTLQQCTAELLTCEEHLASASGVDWNVEFPCREEKQSWSECGR